ncbi:unnamed protein product [Closterium sp. NIES-54]
MRRRILLRDARLPSKPARNVRSKLQERWRHAGGRRGRRRIRRVASCIGDACSCGDVDSAVIADPQIDSGGGGICVAIPSSPRAFPHQELPPWHFPVALLKLLDERHSRRDSAQGGEQRGGLGEMHAVVYSAGCKASVPAAFSSNRRQRMGRLRLIRVAKSVEDMEADFVVEETKKTNEMVGVYTREIERAAEGLSIRVDVLRAHEDVCRFIGQEEGDLRRGGVKDKMVGKDGWESWKWRTKLVMDFVYVARQCLATRPKYVLLLQDDTLPAKLYDVGIEKFPLIRDSYSQFNPKRHPLIPSMAPCGTPPRLLTLVVAWMAAVALLSPAVVRAGINRETVIDASQLAVLRALSKEWRPGFNYSRAWASKQPPKRCMAYPGIICNDKGIIIGLNVSNTNINGTIKGVSALTALALLNLNQNYLSTPLPPFVTALTALTHLDLGFNDFSGSLPPGFGNLKNLKKLAATTLHVLPPSLPLHSSLSTNHSLSTNLGRVLSHGGDALGGKLPSSFSSLTNLRELYMNDNAFGGSIPAYIGSFLSLSYLRLSNNMFSGNIPKELSRLKSLQFLSLNYNKLSGSIPAQLTRLANIQSINLESNYLSGTLPNIDRLKLLTDM